MYIQPLQPVEQPGCYHVGGDVTIHPSATIASGTLLRADPNCKIAIGAGACLGMGVLLHASEGTIEIEAGANLGAGVLVVGYASVGSHSCVGSSSTMRNSIIEAGQIIPPGSLMGPLEARSPAREASPSKQAESVMQTDLNASVIPSHAPAAPTGASQVSGLISGPPVDPALAAGPPVEGNLSNGAIEPIATAVMPPTVSAEPTASSHEAYASSSQADNGAVGSADPSALTTQAPPQPPARAFGKSQVNRLMKSLFPHAPSSTPEASDSSLPPSTPSEGS
ncbi:hypothetical protein [Synechococcus sp. PCC 7336]|uniref:hypothetical protein n=1 Tax=Synechococcus sp. PCC 7336 TaxID=195250 RepID=UPI000348FB29|nr:hypothetical protein [Synechococcus sp. PCC 7336]